MTSKVGDLQGKWPGLTVAMPSGMIINDPDGALSSVTVWFSDTEGKRGVPYRIWEEDGT